MFYGRRADVAGHPTVCDEKYSDPSVYHSDLRWCPRNFLHRFKLIFEDPEGRQHVAQAGLPEDLRQALRGLRALEAEDGDA